MLPVHLGRSLSWNLAKVQVTENEARRLLAHGIAEPTLQQYAASRRSNLLIVTVPTLISAILSTTTFVAQGSEGLSRLGWGLNFVSTLILYALPMSALAAARCWTNLRRSQRLTFIGWGLAFIPPILIALCPVRWWYAQSVAGGPGQPPDGTAGVRCRRRALLLFAADARGAVVASGVDSGLPPSQDLAAGLDRAGLVSRGRCAFLLLLWLVALVAVNHLAGNLLLILSVGLWVGARWFTSFGRTCSSGPSRMPNRERFPGYQVLARAVVGLALVLLAAYLLTKEVFGMHLIGLDAETSLVWLWQNRDDRNVVNADVLSRATALVWVGDLNLFDVGLEYFSRSLFMTAVFADVLLWINVSVWYHEKKFADSENAATYDRAMASMSESLLKET